MNTTPVAAGIISTNDLKFNGGTKRNSVNMAKSNPKKSGRNARVAPSSSGNQTKGSAAQAAATPVAPAAQAAATQVAPAAPAAATLVAPAAQAAATPVAPVVPVTTATAVPSQAQIAAIVATAVPVTATAVPVTATAQAASTAPVAVAAQVVAAAPVAAVAQATATPVAQAVQTAAAHAAPVASQAAGTGGKPVAATAKAAVPTPAAPSSVGSTWAPVAGPLAPNEMYTVNLCNRWWWVCVLACMTFTMLISYAGIVLYNVKPTFQERYELRYGWQWVDWVSTKFSDSQWVWTFANYLVESWPVLAPAVVVEKASWRVCLAAATRALPLIPLGVAAVFSLVAAVYSGLRHRRYLEDVSDSKLDKLVQLARGLGIDSRATTVSQPKSTPTPIAFSVISELRDEVEYLTLGKARTKQGLDSLNQYFDRKWREQEMPIGEMLTLRRMVVACYQSISPCEAQLDNYILSKETRNAVSTHNRAIGAQSTG